ncbi:MAG: redoxin domain-containing protein [Ruegeria sp.]|uniref:redoxin domain-containing protein n=1 Tax=Ruegeria sp. TaxID=1879320 RepID=UPI00349E5D7E
MLIPGKSVPELKIETLGHGTFDLDRDHGENGTLVINYRGLHCPICIRQMGEVEEALDDFAELGIEVIMISTDTGERAGQTVEKAGTSRLRVGHDLPLAEARDKWGLYLSEGREGTAEAPFFAEPGHFFIAPDRTLYFGWTQSTPFARPSIADIKGGIKYALDNKYPPRGTYTGPIAA